MDPEPRTMNELIADVQAGRLSPAEAALAAHPYALANFCPDRYADSLTMRSIREAAPEQPPAPARTLEGGLVSDGMRASYRHIDD